MLANSDLVIEARSRPPLASDLDFSFSRSLRWAAGMGGMQLAMGAFSALV